MENHVSQSDCSVRSAGFFAITFDIDFSKEERSEGL
jgi:hypothetical protein